MEITKVYTFDLEHELIHMDNILKKYITLPEGCTYVKGSRFPLESRRNLDNLINSGLVSDIPFHPTMPAAILRDYIYMYAASVNPNRNLLRNNVIINKATDVYPSKIYGYNNEAELIMDYIPNISPDDAITITNILYRTHIPITNIIDGDIDCIYSICIDTSYIKLIKHIDIRAYRYTEALEYIEINT